MPQCGINATGSALSGNDPFPSWVPYRPFGCGQSAFQISAVLGGGFCAGKMNDPLPHGGLIRRGVIAGVIDHRRLVEGGGGKSFVSPILIEKGGRLHRSFAKQDGKLGENVVDESFFLVALNRRYADKAGQAIRILKVVGTIMDFAQRAPFAECLAREAVLPPERFLVKGAEFRLAGHPRADFQHFLGQVMRQVRRKENRGGGEAWRQGKDDLAGPETGPWRFPPGLRR